MPPAACPCGLRGFVPGEAMAACLNRLGRELGHSTSPGRAGGCHSPHSSTASVTYWPSDGAEKMSAEEKLKYNPLQQYFNSLKALEKTTPRHSRVIIQMFRNFPRALQASPDIKARGSAQEKPRPTRGTEGHSSPVTATSWPVPGLWFSHLYRQPAFKSLKTSGPALQCNRQIPKEVQP